MGCDFLLPPETADDISEWERGEVTVRSAKEEQERDRDENSLENGTDAREDEGADKPGDKDNEERVKETNQEDKFMPKRILGKTGLAVSVFSLGGSFTISRASHRSEAERIINKAIDSGVNYIDTARSYNDSESNIGAALGRRRKDIYLASKSGSRDYDGVMRDIERSLQYLKTDYLDVYQLHGIHSDNDLERIFANDGAVRAFEELKSDGTIRFTGITGHKNYFVMLKALGSYDFDVLLMPLNPGEVHDDSFAVNVLPVALRKRMGIVAMKLASYGRLFRPDGIRNMSESLGYVLSCPVNTAIIGISNMSELEENVEIAKAARPLQSAEMEELEERSRPFQREANFFKYSW